MEIILLGDQLAECQPFLREVFALTDNLILKSLLERVTSTLRQEILYQPNRSFSKRVPRFSTVKELFEWYCKSGQPNPALESTFLCLAQFAHFVWSVPGPGARHTCTDRWRSYFEERNRSYLEKCTQHSDGPHIIGACTGLLTASAIASANSLTTLLPVAVETVRIAFRTGLHVGEVAEGLEGSSDACESWSTIVSTSDKKAARDAVDQFNKANVSNPFSPLLCPGLNRVRHPHSQAKFGSARIRQIPLQSVVPRQSEDASSIYPMSMPSPSIETSKLMGLIMHIIYMLRQTLPPSLTIKLEKFSAMQKFIFPSSRMSLPRRSRHLRQLICSKNA